jgi:hypothetical protein
VRQLGRPARKIRVLLGAVVGYARRGRVKQRLWPLLRRLWRWRRGWHKPEFPAPSPYAPRLIFTARLDAKMISAAALDPTKIFTATLDSTIVNEARML